MLVPSPGNLPLRYEPNLYLSSGTNSLRLEKELNNFLSKSYGLLNLITQSKFKKFFIDSVKLEICNSANFFPSTSSFVFTKPAFEKTNKLVI